MRIKQRRKTSPGAGSQVVEWEDTNHRVHAYEFHAHMQNVASARYVIRRVQRIIDECVRSQGIDPLDHQAMIQIYGSQEKKLPIGHLAERLDVVPALASRLVRKLEKNGLVRRTRSRTDRRATYVSATAAGVRLLHAIVASVFHEVTYFQSKLSAHQQRSAMEVFAFYVGLRPDLGEAGIVGRSRGSAPGTLGRARKGVPERPGARGRGRTS